MSGTSTTEPPIIVAKNPEAPDRHVLDLRFTARARAGLEHFLRHAWPGGDRRLLLPAYIGLSPIEGSGVMDPVEALGVPFDFYSLRPDLAVDLESLAALLAERPVFAVMVIHYFGFPEPETLEIAELCRSRDALLIEDCAHAFGARLGDRAAGSIGDVALFSIHKVLPADGGGILRVNRASLSIPPLPAELSGRAEHVTAVARADHDEIARIRRRNYEELARSVEILPSVRLLHPKLPDGAVPLNLPLVLGAVDRFDVYRRLRAHGVGAVALYHTLVPPIREEAHPSSHALSRTILNLPIHQDVPRDRLEWIATMLREALALASSAPAVRA